MPDLKIVTNTDRLADLGPKRLLRAISEVTFEQINVLRQNAGLPVITAEQARQAIIAAYRGQNG